MTTIQPSDVDNVSSGKKLPDLEDSSVGSIRGRKVKKNFEAKPNSSIFSPVLDYSNKEKSLDRSLKLKTQAKNNSQLIEKESKLNEVEANIFADINIETMSLFNNLISNSIIPRENIAVLIKNGDIKEVKT